MYSKEIYKRAILSKNPDSPEEFLISGLSWIRDNIKRELKLIPVNTETFIQNKILTIQYPSLSYILEEDMDYYSNSQDNICKLLVRIGKLKPINSDTLDDLCEIISTIRKNSEEQAILKGFKLS